MYVKIISPLRLTLAISFFLVFSSADGQANSYATGAFFKKFEVKGALKGHVIEKYPVTSLVECGLKCLSSLPDCKSLNYVTEDHSQSAICEINNISKSHAHKDEFVRQSNSEYFEPVNEDENQDVNQASSFTDGPWTLVARFSNNDRKNWMEDDGTWWYDTVEPHGNTFDPSDNADMISEDFWLQQGSEFKITKSDDPTHTALLTTTGNCLNGMTFREKMKSYGVFRDIYRWAKEKCLGSCSVSYGGDYVGVSGFSQAQCDGTIQHKNEIGFWCHCGSDGSVLMIGGGGRDICNRGDHGIGITENSFAKFNSQGENELDFGDNPDTPTPTTLYSLNLWVRV